MNEEYRLQLLSHGEVFSTREEAIEYIDDNFKVVAKWAEPAIFFYGDVRNPKMIVAVGASKDPRKPRVYVIDDAEVREIIAAVQELAEKNAEDIQSTAECLLETINAVGLTIDDNKIKNKVSYEPDPDDILIRNAETVAEAIAIISTFVQEKVKDLSTTFEDTKSIDFTTIPLEEGSIVKADVKISTDGDDDDLDFNNNIVGVRNDGLFAACGLEYDADHNRLIFTSSGVKNGRFSPDAIRKVIDLGEHTIYTADNEGHNIEVIINQERGTISADAKISQNQDNILSVTDGKLFVEGRAKNIKFQNTNVAAKLVEITNAIDEIKDKISVLILDDLIIGDESDSVVTRAIKNPNGGYTITADTRFGSDNSIVIANGGLSANIDVEVDTAANKLVLKVGNVNKSVTLPGVSIIDNIYYDSANKAIIITWKDGSQQTVIPVGDMLKTWDVYNNPSSAVTLTKSSPATGPELLSAEVKIRTTDNLLGKTSGGELFVNKSDIDNAIANVQNAVTAETNARIAADGELSASIAETNAQVNLVNTNLTSEINRAQTAEAELGADITSLGERVSTAEEKASQAIADASDAKALVELTNANLTAEINRAQTAETANATAIGNEASRAQSAEAALANRATALESGLANEVSERTSKDAVQDEKIANLETASTSLANRATALEGGLAVETDARSTADAVQNEKIANLAAGLENVVETHEQDIEALSAQIHENRDSIAVLNGSETTSGSVLEAVKGAKTYAETLAANEEARAREKETALETSITNEVTRATAAETQILTDGKAYTDHAVADAKVQSDIYTDNAKADAIAQSKAYTDEKVDGLETSSKAYTDEKVEAEKTRAMAAEGANATAITALQQKDEEIEIELGKKVEDVKIVKNSASDLQYILKVDGQDAGVIDIPKDKFLKSASYDAGNKDLVFVFVTDEGDETVRVNIADLVDTYTAGNGLALSADNQFSVKVNEDSESYLTVTAEGIKVSGINAALAAKANAADVYTKTEVDDKIDAIVIPDVSNFATKDEVEEAVEGLQTQVTSNTERITSTEGAITIINGNEAQEGSIKKALADAKGYADAKVSAEETRATAVESTLTEAVAIINGNEAQEGSIKKALADAKGYTDSEIAGLSSSVESEFATVNENVANKANKSEVYTKAEIEAKGYLVDSDIAGLATKTEVNNEVTRAQDAESNLQAAIDTANSNIATNTSDIAEMKREERRLNLIVDETNSVKLVKSKDDSGTELSANVKLDTSSTNILRITGNGIIADVEMSYNQASNTITFSNGISTQEIVLAGASLVEDGYYNSTTKQIILVTRLTDGTLREIAIDASALIHTLKVQNSPNNPVKLYKTVDSEGVDVLSASIDISTESHNLILNNNGTLYASNEAKNHTALWEGNEMSLQAVLELLKSMAEEGSEAAEEIDEIKDELHRVEVEVVSMQTSINTLDRRVTDNTTAIAQQEGAINTLSNQVSALNSAVTNLSNEFTELKNEVETYDGRLTDLENDNTIIKENVSTINSKLGDISVEHPVSERLDTIESELYVTDNGTY